MPEGVGFCPFCRESFEDAEVCPEHELSLVGFDQLGPDPEDLARDPAIVDVTPVSLASPGRGRLWVALGALLAVISLGCEMVQGVGGHAGLRGFELAIPVPVLWTPVGVAFMAAYVLRSRRTPRQMRSLRVVVPFLAAMCLAAAGWATYRVTQGLLPALLAARPVGDVPGPGLYVLVLAGLSLLAGGVRFGVSRR